jgi:hypothetical protein
MKRKLKRQELILLAAWIIILLPYFGFSMIQKVYSRYNRLDGEIAANKAKLARLNAIVNRERELNGEYQNAFSGYRPIKDSDSLLQEINAIAKRLNVNITNIKPASVKDEASYRSYSIRIEGQEDITEITNFLNVLTQEIRGVNIERLQISAQNRDELPKVSISINALVFKQ